MKIYHRHRCQELLEIYATAATGSVINTDATLA